MGGAYGGRNATVDVVVDESLCNNLWFVDDGGYTSLPVTPMPQRYYTLLSSVIPYNGDARGYVEVQFNDEFFNDPDAIKNTYVIPLRMTGVSGIDAILSGTPIVSSPVRTNAQDWAVLPMDYVLYCVKYMNPWQGKYIRRGVDMVTENGGEPTKNQNDEVCAITTKNRTEAIFPVSFKTSGASISCNLILKFNGDKCTISCDDENVTAEGEGEFFTKGTERAEYKDYQWGSSNGKLVQRDILRLAYNRWRQRIRWLFRHVSRTRESSSSINTK